MPNLDSETISLGQLFTQEFFFRIPEYQRPFLWDADNLTDLIDDLESAPRASEYFLGTLVLHTRGESQYDVVDGQQRLTAICILLACIRDAPALAESDDYREEIHAKILQPAKALDDIPEKNRVEVRDQAIFNRVVAKPGGTSDVAGIEAKGPSEERYLLACDIYTKRLAEMSIEEVKDLASYMSQKCVFIYLATDSFQDAFRLFTIVNDRGQQLRRIDILKANNLDPEVIGNEATRARYAHLWETMEEQLGEQRFEEIFHHLRLIYLRAKPQGDLLKEFQERIFGKPKMPKLGKTFLDTLQGQVELYDAIFLAQDYIPGDAQEYAAYKTVIQAMVLMFPASEWKACLLSFASKFGREHFYEYVLAIEKVYLEHWVGGVRKDERYTTYTTLLTSIDQAEVAEVVIDAVEYDAEAIQEACKRKNFYSSGFSKYLLLRAEILASELDSPRSFVVRSVEHVLPQKPPAESGWRSSFTEEDIEELVHTSGNLVLLSKSKNSAASNREFPDKKESYLKPRVSDFPRSVQVLGEAMWDRKTIEARTEQLAKTILDDPS